jgi:hypothetical protein
MMWGGGVGFWLIYVGWIALRRRMPQTAEIEAGAGAVALRVGPGLEAGAGLLRGWFTAH